MNKSKIYILSALNNGFFKPLTVWMNDHNESEVELIESQHINNLYLRCLAGAWKTLCRTQKDDIVVCMYDFQGVLLFWLCKLLFTYRNIVVINLLNKAGTGLAQRIMNYLYKVALSASNHTVATVTSRKYGEWLNEKLNIKANYVLLRDCNYDYYKYKKDTITEVDNTVFCGGNNARDWDFILKVAKELPSVKFVLMPGTTRYNMYKGNGIPENVTMYSTVPFDKFMEEEMKATIVAMPLETEAPAGLIAIFQAGANSKFVMATKTETMKDYIGEDRGVMEEKNVSKWKDSINYYLNASNLRKKKANQLHKFIEEECSLDNYYNTIYNIINSFNA